MQSIEQWEFLGYIDTVTNPAVRLSLGRALPTSTPLTTPWPLCMRHIIDARYRLVLKDTDISSRRTKLRYQYRYQSYGFLKSISIQIPILTIFKKDINTNTNTDNIQKGYQYQYQYLIFSKTISIPIPIPHIFKSTNIAAVPALPEPAV